MKITLDLDKLLHEEKITEDEYDRLLKYSSKETSLLAFNILIGFSVIAVGGAFIGLMQSLEVAFSSGLLVLFIGMILAFKAQKQWSILSNILVTTGVIVCCGSLCIIFNASLLSMELIAVVLGLTGVLLNSALLIVLSILDFSSISGVSTDYFRETYFLGVQHPLTTVVEFSILSVIFYFLATKFTASKYERPCIIAARTSVFLVNLGFWVGSLWEGDFGTTSNISSNDFSAVWAIALISVTVWAWKNNRRWVLNTAAVFGGIHFYTQYFIRLHASLGAVLIIGLLTMIFALVLRKVNSYMD